MFKLLGVKDFMPSNAVTQWFASDICSGQESSLFCSNIIFVLCGYDMKNLNMVRKYLVYNVSRMVGGLSSSFG